MKLKKKFLKLLGKTTVVPKKLREHPAKEVNNLEYADKFALGHELRRAREKSSQDLRDIANLLRIRYEYLKAIEEGDIEALPGSTYMVGFVKTYAKYLGLDPKQSVRFFKSSMERLCYFLLKKRNYCNCLGAKKQSNSSF